MTALCVLRERERERERELHVSTCMQTSTCISACFLKYLLIALPATSYLRNILFFWSRILKCQCIFLMSLLAFFGGRRIKHESTRPLRFKFLWLKLAKWRWKGRQICWSLQEQRQWEQRRTMDKFRSEFKTSHQPSGSKKKDRCRKV